MSLKRKLRHILVLCLQILALQTLPSADSKTSNSSGHQVLLHSDVNPLNSSAPKPLTKELSIIQEATSVFLSRTDLISQGYPVFTQRVKRNSSGKYFTIYTSEKDPKLSFESKSNDDGQTVVVLTDVIIDDLDEDVVRNCSLILIQCVKCKDKYTAHLAYIR